MPTSNDRRVRVDWAMRYGNPPIRSRLEALAAQDCGRILIVPLYPQYAAATTATVCDEAFRSLSTMRFQPTLRVAAPYYAEPVYIDALASSLNAAVAKLKFRPDVIVASYHGMPEAYVEKGDPYERHCIATVRHAPWSLGYVAYSFGLAILGLRAYDAIARVKDALLRATEAT